MHKSIFIRITCKAILILVLLYTHSFAGEDVPLLGRDGAILKPSQIANVDIKNTCGDCHDIFELGKSVHFSRTNSNSGANSFECLSCHLGHITSDGKIKKTPRNPDNDSCVSCHSHYEWVVNADKVHKKMSCYDCHQDAGHKNSGPASCSNCHSAKGKGVVPKHSGFTNQHFQKIACETCHIPVNQSENGNKEPSYSIATDGAAKGKIIPLAGSTKLSHGVSRASASLGKGEVFKKSGCLDCHSFNSSFFFWY